jgi:hypothetical protein
MCFNTGHQLVLGGDTPPQISLHNGWKVPLKMHSNLFYLQPTAVEHQVESVLATTAPDTLENEKISKQDLLSLHCNLGHTNVRSICRRFHLSSQEIQCDCCLMVNTTRQPLPDVSLAHTALKPGEITHVDYTGPLPVPGPRGELYVLLTLDDKSGLPISYIAQSRKSPSKILDQHIEKVAVFPKTTSPITIGAGCVIQSDNEFFTEEMKKMCALRHIQQHVSPPYTPQLNSRPERMLLTLYQRTRALLHYSGAALSLWPFA